MENVPFSEWETRASRMGAEIVFPSRAGEMS
jgi:hypothetical protein